MKINEVVAGPLAFNRKLDNNVIATLRKECAPYIEEQGGYSVGLWNAINRRPLWRGIPDFDWNEYSLPILNIKVDQNRSPRDMPRETHDMLNEWFQKKTGIAYRSQSIFGTGSYREAKQYATDFDSNIGGGAVAVVLPVGRYKYCWSPKISDLYSYIEENVMDWSKDDEENKQNIFAALDIAGYRFNKDLGPGLESGHEIMIHCQHAIVVNETYREYLINKYKYK